MAGRITAEYTCLACANDASQVDATLLLSARVCATIFSCTFLMSSPHLSLVSIYTPSTLISALGAIVSSAILIAVVAAMLNFFGLPAKGISSYFSGAKVGLC